MSVLARRKSREAVVRVSLAPPEPAPAASEFPAPCVSYIGQLGAGERSALDAPCGRWLVDTAKRAYSAAGHKLDEETRPRCSRRV